MASDTIIGLDTETHLIGPDAVIPKLVCLTVAEDAETCALAATADAAELAGLIEFAFPEAGDAEAPRIVGQNIAFDLAVLCRYDPRLWPRVFAALEAGRIGDTKLREKLLNLASTGQIDTLTNPDGSKTKIAYGLDALVLKYLGLKIEKAKMDGKQVVGAPDAWRLNYAALEGIPSAQWPEEARKYAIDDSILTKQVWLAQEDRRKAIMAERGIDPLAVEPFRVAVAFALHLATVEGIAVDAEQKKAIDALLAEELKPEKLALLVEAGILRPAVPPQPYANGAKDHRPDCTDKKTCSCPVKMTGGVKESVNETRLKEYVLKLAKENSEIQLRYTAPSSRFPEGQLQTDAEFFEDYAHLDPVLEQYKHRQDLQKLVTTELPRMCWPDKDGVLQVAARVYPEYDSLKATGRTSSFAGKLFPSFNCQNVDPRARAAYIPDPGKLLFSVDFSAMELVSLAQTCLWLFKHSVLADKINAGIDPHAYLGAQLAYALDPDFRSTCDEADISGPDAIYEAFASCKKSEMTEARDFFKHYRKFAKPTGLGYPGGLGAKTFVRYAKATYGVLVDEETAKQLREVWFATYPEMREYFNFINRECQDLLPQYVIQKIYEVTNGDALVVTGVGQHQMWAAQHWVYDRPHTLITAGGLGTMGFGLPAAIGAKVGCPNETVWCLDGDGGFQATIKELATIVQEGLNIKIGILNNGYLGTLGIPFSGPDFVRVAGAYGIPGLRVTRMEGVVPAVEQASRVLFCLAEGDSCMSLLDVCARVGFHKSKAFSILETLQGFGLVRKGGDGKGYTLGPGLSLSPGGSQGHRPEQALKYRVFSCGRRGS